MKVLTYNKKVNFNYKFSKKYIVGIALIGSEVKSILKGDYSFDNAFVLIRNDECFLHNFYIKKYDFNFDKYDEKRTKKLLLNKKEIKEIKNEVKAKKQIIIPIKIFIINRFIKMEIGIGKAIKKYEKREKEKEKDFRVTKNKQDFY